MTNMCETVRAWLASQQGRNICRGIAEGLQKRMANRCLAPSFLPNADAWPRQDAIDEIESELILFILKKCEVFQQRIEAASPEERRMRYVQLEHFLHPPYLRQAFYNQILSDVRSAPHMNIFHYLYKKAGDVLRTSDRCVTRSIDKKYIHFTFEQAAAETLVADPEAYDIGFPDHFTDLRTIDHIKKRAVILKLAEHVHGQCRRFHDDRPVWIRLNDFVGWMLAHIDTPPGALDKMCRIDDPEISKALGGQQAATGAIGFDAAQVSQWARMAAFLLNGKQKMAYSLRVGCNLTLEETAARMGMKHASNASYHLESAYRVLKVFLGDKPWLAPDDPAFSQDAFDLFYRVLICELKNNAS